MADEVATTPAQEVKQPEETATPAPEATPEAAQPKEEPKEQTVGEVLKQEPKHPKPDTVPFARLDKEIAKRKELEAELEALKSKAADQNMSKAEITTNLKALAEEHGIDPGFLGKLAGAIRAEAEAGLEERLRPITEREKAEKIDKAFQKGFKQAMENMPEYDGVVNPEVIKSLSLDPSNASKTFRQIIEDTYGNALGGKRTIETSTPRGGNTPGTVDMDKARKDPTYFKEVMADPELKKQYNAGLAERIVR